MPSATARSSRNFPAPSPSYDDHMQAARTKMSLDERQAQVTGIRQSADDAEAFKERPLKKRAICSPGATAGAS